MCYAFSVNGYAINECKNCDHRMTSAPTDTSSHITQVYDDNYFFQGGAGYPNYIENQKILFEHGRRYGKLLACHGIKAGKLLDVGCAAGFVLKGLINSGWEGYGIEPNETMARYAKAVLDLSVIRSGLEEFESGQRFDLICLIQVIAHFLNPDFAITQIKKMLKEKGTVLVETWNSKSFTARAFCKRWHEYSPPSVLHWFSKRSLDLLMSKHGFDLLMTGRPKKYISFKHGKSLILHKMKASKNHKFFNMLLKFYPDSARIPYPGDDLFYALYKKA
jgi:2-polyprenyl-3-methyl-5-hydroxy-6-metoxy-1,4-benzoquinol methylase